MNSIEIMAYAKINLGIDVLGKRPDGYHDVSMIMQTINLFDEISIYKTNNKSISITSNISTMPLDQGNIVYKMADLFRKHFNISQGFNINIQKNIPIAAGLAGGSSDAASTLIALSKLFNIKAKQETLMKLGLQIGADIPFCIVGGTAKAQGIGEKITPLPPMPKVTILLVNPGIEVSTPFVYKNLVLSDNLPHPNIENMETAIREKDLLGLSGSMGNILENVTLKEYPVIQDIKDDMMKEGALVSLMSGSGSSVFSLFNNEDLAGKAYLYFKEKNLGPVFLTKPFWP